jgi:hypothetical protein
MHSLVRGQIKLGDNPTDITPYALLELESTSKGFVLSSMTTLERDTAFDFTTPEGILIYNTDTDQLQYLRRLIDPSTK